MLPSIKDWPKTQSNSLKPEMGLRNIICCHPHSSLNNKISKKCLLSCGFSFPVHEATCLGASVVLFPVQGGSDLGIEARVYTRELAEARIVVVYYIKGTLTSLWLRQ